MKAPKTSLPTPGAPRRSGSAEASLAHELKRLEGTSVLDRGRAALEMRERFGEVRPIADRNEGGAPDQRR